MTTTGWATPLIQPGSNLRFRLEVTPVNGAIGPPVFEVELSASALGGTAALDTIHAVTRRPNASTDAQLANRAPDGTPGNNKSAGAELSADGRYVAFASAASSLIPRDFNSSVDVFVLDRTSQRLELISQALDGTPGNGPSHSASISRDGRFVAFHSSATNLVAGDTNDREDIFLKDRTTGQLTRVSVAWNGTQLLRSSDYAVLSGNGQFVAFESLADNVALSDSNSSRDVFVYDRSQGTRALVSRSASAEFGNNDSVLSGISSDGRFVALTSYASNFAPNDANNTVDAFLFDRTSGSLELISRAASGASGDGPTDAVSMSDVARYLAFSSLARNLPANGANGFVQIYLLDRSTGNLRLISTSAEGLAGNGDSLGPIMSSDGRWVAFTSGASNLAPGDTNHFDDVFVYDRLAGTLRLVSRTSEGISGNDHSMGSGFSADGRYLVYDSSARNLLGEHAREGSQVLVQDLTISQSEEPSSALRLIWVQRTPSGPVEIQWLSQTNRVYRVERAESLDHGFSVVGNSLVATPPVNTYRDVSPPAGGTGFYRIRVEPP